MRKLLVITAVVMAFCLSSFAQRAEVFGGYAYTNVQTPDERVGLHGWDANVTGLFNENFGIMADFSGAYGTPSVAGFDVDVTDHFYLFGPVVRTNVGGAAASAHALFGGVRSKGEVAGIEATDSSFAWALGGAFDVNAGENFAIRLGQFDYIRTNFDGDSTNNHFRYAAGVVLRF
ncbi:MAG TPA: hypothetical protein VEG32_10835 [Clostridia bacterium]|nr:hypothetical protein [Clostridia bacterium]